MIGRLLSWHPTARALLFVSALACAWLAAADAPGLWGGDPKWWEASIGFGWSFGMLLAVERGGEHG